jgi:altronate dehydratase
MNASGLGAALGLDRFVALTHTEGCGFGGESMYQLLVRTYRGYATHPNVAAALLLEHGCEKIPNDAMRRQFEANGLPLERFGWASVQLGGGIDKALGQVESWFARTRLRPATRVSAGLGAMQVGLLSAPPVSRAGAAIFVGVARAILGAGGSVLIPESDPLLVTAEFRDTLLGTAPARATLAYGQTFTAPGLHLVATDSDHWVENLTGMGASGACLFVGLVGRSPQQGHPMISLIQVGEPGVLAEALAQDVDLVLTDDAIADEETLLRLVVATAGGKSFPVANRGGLVDFQISRGLLGVST